MTEAYLHSNKLFSQGNDATWKSLSCCCAVFNTGTTQQEGYVFKSPGSRTFFCERVLEGGVNVVASPVMSW